MFNSSQAHGLQPTRLLHPWDFPGKSTGVGCHCLLLVPPRIALKNQIIINVGKNMGKFGTLTYCYGTLSGSSSNG